MEYPTFDNFVRYEKNGPLTEDGFYPYYDLMGIKNTNSDNLIYLWRNYNTFDDFPTKIPNDFNFVHNGYIDCDECNSLNRCCPKHLKARNEYIEKYRFGTKIFVEDYTPKNVTCKGDIYFTHDNGGRPFKVYVDNSTKELHIFSLNRSLIFKKKSDRRDYSYCTIFRLAADTEVQLAMNDQCTPCNDNNSNNDSCGDNDKDCSNSSESSLDNDEDNNQPIETEEYDEAKYYDQHIASYTYEKIWIPNGFYLTRNEESNVVRDECNSFIGNSILACIGNNINGKGRNKYISIGSSVDEFTIDDEIQKYYSIVGNSDVPYPVAIGLKYIIFMLDFEAESIRKYSNLNEEQLADAYTYFYGHSCVKCFKHKCKCELPEYENGDISKVTICKRDF